MKIVIKTPGSALPITIGIPIGLVKNSDFLWNMAIKHTHGSDRELVLLARELIPECTDILMEAARENGGHFDLVEVKSSSGAEVIIQI